MKVSSFVVAMFVVGLCVSLLMLFMADLNTWYGEGDYNETSLQSYQKLGELNLIVNETRTEASGLGDPTGGLDLVGLIRKTGQALTIGLKSLDVFTTMASDSVAQNALGDSGALLETYGVGIVIVLLIIGGLIAAYIKYET